MARPLGGGGGEASTDLRQRLSFLKKRPRDPGQVVFAGLEQHHHEPLEVNVVDTSTGTGGLGSCGEGADKSSPSTSGQGCMGTTATASPRSLAATTASMTTPSHSPGFVDPDAIMTSNEESSPTPPPLSPDHVGNGHNGLNDSLESEEPRVQIGGGGEDVVLRRNTINGYRRAILKRNSYSTNEAGRLLKFCLEKHFGQPNEQSGINGGGSCQDEALDNYITEVFHQLDYHRCGTVSREDFDTLCEVLDLRPASRPTSGAGAVPTTSHYRLSGLEWLSSYRTDRGRSPLSPLRTDKLSEVKYRGPKRPLDQKDGATVQPQPPNFLFTIGPRPFWEMWPQKKRRKRRLTIDDFKRALLEQWAKTHGIASNRVSVLFSPLINLASASNPTSPIKVASIAQQMTAASNGIHHRNHRHIRSVRVQPIPVVDTVDHARNGHAATHRSQGYINKGRNGLHHQQPQQPQRSVHYETRTKRFFRRLARVSRRVHFIRRLSRRIRRENIGPPLQPRIPSSSINPALRPESIKSQDMTDHHIPAEARPERPEPVHKVMEQQVPQPPNVEKQKHRVHLLERQVEHQQTEISGLRDVVEDLRSSLHLSDAQNLALQVLLKKMSKAEVEAMGPPEFRTHMNESEKHLENLVKELKEMSQTRYPRYLPNANNMNGASSSTATSINNEGCNMTLPDFVLEDEVQETSKVLGEASDELKAATNELEVLASVTRLSSSPDAEEEISLQEAYRALETATNELNKMR